MIKRKVNGSYVPANYVKVIRQNCPVESTLEGAFMKVINGIWQMSVAIKLFIIEHRLNFSGLLTTVNGHTLSLPSETGVEVVEHSLRRN